MEWVEVSVETKTEAADLVTAAFTDIGAGGVEIDDPALINAYIDEGRWDYRDMERKPETGMVVVRSYLANDEELDGKVRTLKASLEYMKGRGADLGTAKVSTNIRNDEDWVDNWKKYSFEDKKVISYSQNYYAPVLSLEADFNYAKHFETTLKLDASWIKQIDCMDIHHAKNAQYNDRIQNAWKFGGNIGMYYKINQMHKLGLKGNIAYIPPAYGFTYGSTTSTSPDTSSLGGTSRLLWNYSFVYVFSF